VRTEAIILKKIPIREFDLLVICYTKHAGKQTYVAKYARRATSKQVSHLDLLNYVDFTSVLPKNSSKDLISNGHPIITQATSLRTYHNLKSSLPVMAVAFFVLEVFNKLIYDGQDDHELWNFLIENLENLDKLSRQKNIFWPKEVETIRKKLLKIMGYHADTSIEELANTKFHSLQFLENVIE
jgi:DNA repair protein RecO